MENPPQTRPSPTPSKPWMPLVSLALAIHCLCVFFALASNLQRSPLERRLMLVLRPYVRTLHLDPDGTPLHLTHGSNLDSDFRLQVLPRGADADDPSQWVRIGGGHWRGSEPRLRIHRLARLMEVYVDQEQTAGRMARDVAQYALTQLQLEPARIRCQRHFLQAPDEVEGSNEARRNPNDPSFFETAYEAAVVVQDDQVSIVKLSPPQESASPGWEGER